MIALPNPPVYMTLAETVAADAGGDGGFAGSEKLACKCLPGSSPQHSDVQMVFISEHDVWTWMLGTLAVTFRL